MKLNVLKVETLSLGQIVQRRSVDDLRADGAYHEVFVSVREQGLTQPVLVDTTFAIVDGAHRVQAARDNRLVSVPAVVLDPAQVDVWWNALLEVKAGRTPERSPLVDDLTALGALSGVGNGPGARERYAYDGPRALTIAMYLTLVCDSRCAYCFWRNKPEAHPPIDVAATGAKLRELRRSRRLRQQLWGGEPTIHPQFVDLCRAASPWVAQLLVTSNGLQGPDVFERALSPSNALVSLSYHPRRTTLGAYLATFERLLAVGFDVHGTAVKWPPQVDAVREWAEVMRDQHPERYQLLDCWVEADRDFVGTRDLREHPSEAKRPDHWRDPKGQKCETGRDFVAVLFHEGGRVVRCLSGRPLRGEAWPDFELFDKAEPCPSNAPCACGRMHQYWDRS